MTLYDYFNAFSRYIEEDSPTDKSIVLYWVLLDTFNRRGWPRWAGVDNQRMMLMCRTSDPHVMRRARDALCNAGFLEYKPGKKGRATEYGLLIPEKYGGGKVGEFTPGNTPEIGNGGEFPHENAPENIPESIPENVPPNKTKTETETENQSVCQCVTTDPPNLQGQGAEAEAALARVISAYRVYVPGKASGAHMARLADYCRLMGAEVCIRAIATARDAGHNDWGYLEGILRNKAESGVRTLADWDRVEQDRRERNARRNSSHGDDNASGQAGHGHYAAGRNASQPEYAGTNAGAFSSGVAPSADEQWGIRSEI